jgi:O-antigen ligase
MSIFYNYNLKFIQLLIIIFPFLLITGPFLPDLAGVYIGIFYFFLCVKKRDFKIFKSRIFFFLFFLYLYLVVNSFFSFNVKVSLSSSLPFIRIVIFIFALKFFFTNYSDLTKKIYFFYIICITILLIDSLFQFVYGHNLVGLRSTNVERITSFFDKQIMGSYVTRLLPFIIGISYLLNLKKINLINVIVLFISGVLVFLSAERLAFVYFFIILIFYFYINFEKKLLIFFLGLFLLFIGILNNYNKSFFNRIFVHTYNQIYNSKTISITSYRHMLHYEAAYRMFLDKPFFGNGLKSFRGLCGEEKYALVEKIKKDNFVNAEVQGKFYFKIYQELSKKSNVLYYYIGIIDDIGIVHQHRIISPDLGIYFSNYKNGDKLDIGDSFYSYYEFKNGCNTHPHNIYLEFLSELGLLGFSFFFFIFLYSIFNIFLLLKKNIKKRLNRFEMCSLFILTGISITMFPLFPSGSYFNNWLLIITYFPVGLYLSLKHNNV